VEVRGRHEAGVGQPLALERLRGGMIDLEDGGAVAQIGAAERERTGKGFGALGPMDDS
jgi:hypothetical protein